MTTRYRCTNCGNLTRFDVTTSRRERAFHHYSIGGDLEIEDVQVIESTVESVECRWCGPGATIDEIPGDEIGETASDEIAGDDGGRARG